MAYRILLILMVFLLAAPVNGQSYGNTSSADLLRQAQELWNEIRRGWDDKSELWRLNGSPEQVDPDVARQTIAQMQPVIKLIQQAIKQGQPNFPIDYQKPFSRPMPHVMMMRSLHLAMRTDLGYRMYTGDTTGIASDMADLFTFGSFLRQDQTIISSLVDMAVFASASRLISNEAIARGLLSPSDAKVILESINNSLSDDPFGLTAALEAEAVVGAAWMSRMNENDETRTEMMDIFAQWQADEGKIEQANDLMSMTGEEVEVAIHLNQEAMQRMANASAIEDLDVASKEFEQIVEDINNGLYGPIAQSTGLNNNLIEIVKSVIIMSDEVKKNLKELIDNPDGKYALMNAALWYRKAFSLRSQIKEEDWQLIENCADTQTELETDQIDKIMEMTRPIIDVLLEASKIKNCEFETEYNRQHGIIWPLTDYHVPMKDCSITLYASARINASQKKMEASAEQLGVALVMVEHLAQDNILETAYFSQNIFDSTEKQVSQFTEISGSALSISKIKQPFDKLNKEDPFGFRRALLKFRKYTTGNLLYKTELSYAVRDITGQAEALNYRTDTVFIGDAEKLKIEIEMLNTNNMKSLFKSLDKQMEILVESCLAASTTEDVDSIRLEIEKCMNSESITGLQSWYQILATPLPEATEAAIAAPDRIKKLQELIDKAVTSQKESDSASQ